MLIRVTADAPVEQFDLYIRDDSTQQIVFHSGYYPVLAPGEKGDEETGKRDLTKDALKIAIKLNHNGPYTLLLVGVIGALDAGKPAPGATQLFWAGRENIDGTTEIDARLLTVPEGDDADDDLWPDVADFRAHVPEAQHLYGDHPELLDCYDKQVPDDMPITGRDGMPLQIRAETVNPFAVELCGDGYDESCNGDADEACVDEDADGDPRGSDCDDQDPARHKANAKDPFPDPPNCCGYSLGKTGAEEHQSFVGDPLLCPTQRCGNGIDNGCRGSGANDPANDTTCVVDADCDGYPAGNDCDDSDPSIHPGAPEICNNNKSESCVMVNGVLVPDFGCVPCDLDGDGYQRMDKGCPDAADLHPGMVDCNDNDSGVYPGSSAAAGGIEGGINTQGRVATALKGLCRRIYEPTGITGTAKINGGNGYLAGNSDCTGDPYQGCPPPACDADGDGWAKDGSCGQSPPFDCNDNDPTIFPSAPDKCGDGIDGNCSGADTPCAGLDKDGDKYLPPADCDDNNPNVHPFATELCNGVDDDCDGDKDDGNPDPTGKPLIASDGTSISSCTDDNDGECAKKRGRCVCSAAEMGSKKDPNGNFDGCMGDVAKTTSPHCFDAGQPGFQSCNAIDIDENCDGTSSFVPGSGTDFLMLNQPCGLDVGPCKKGMVTGCDRTQTTSPYYGALATPDNVHWICSGTTNPSAEVCNGIDDDCNGVLPANESDPDGDKYIACTGCGSLAAGLLGCDDCDEALATRNPGQPEKCDGMDNDCNPATSDGSKECGDQGKTCCYANGGGNTCRDLSSDTGFCGSCAKSCNSNIFANACAAGGCVCGSTGGPCPMGATTTSPGSWCNGGACTTCNDRAHCGQNCTACASNQVCKADGSGCTGCNSDSDCDTASWCSGGNCIPRKAKGGTCTVTGPEDPEQPDHECLQTAGALYCTDGVCCDTKPSACGLCKQCNVAGNLGSCGNTPAGQESGNECVASVPGCTQSKCNGNGSCAVPDGTNCSGVSCDNSGTEARTIALQCTAGTCGATPATVQLCGDYDCSGGACLTSCAGDGDCHRPTKTNCWPASIGGNGQCYALGTAGDNCVSNTDCNGGACVAGRCCGTTGRPASCGGGSATTSCSGTTLTTYSCTGPSYNNCNSNNTTCSGNLACANMVSCDNACSCGSGACTTPECAAGYYCPANGSSNCSVCDTTAFCGASCTPCTPSCSAGMISGTSCNGSSCSGPVTCPGNFICASGTTCKTSCASDADCTGGQWCKTGGTCEPRINSNSNCDDANCAGATCLQCNMGGTGVVCPAGPGQQKCP